MNNADTPAMPIPFTEVESVSGNVTGLTKREAFAMAAMQGFCSCVVSEDMTDEILAKFSVKAADSLLKELGE